MSKQKILFLLDNGHAPDTRGKRSPVLPNGGRLLEWAFARDIVDRICKKLEGLNIAYHRVTPRTEADLGPTARARLANHTHDALSLWGMSTSVLISVHGNAHRNEFTDANGVTVLHYPTSRTSKRLAQSLQNKLVSASGLRDRGIRGRTDLSLLKKTKMPAILSECGFYSNRNEVALMLSHEGRDMFANAHVQFIAETEEAFPGY